MFGAIAAGWGILGISLFLVYAIYRLALIGLETFSFPLEWYHWLVLLVWVLFMAFKEGYQGFQKGFSPRVAARVGYLRRHPTWLRGLLAPLFCMGYFQIERRQQIVTFALTLGIILLVQLVHLLEQPWRGIVDIGVVVGLTWGVLSWWWFTVQALRDDNFRYSPQVPASSR